MKNKHLTFVSREIIERELKAGLSVMQIADILGCCFKTVYNEIHRGTVVKVDQNGVYYNYYSAKKGHDVAIRNKAQANLKKRGCRLKGEKKTCEKIAYYLKECRFSPNAIVKIFKKENYKFNVRSHNTIYKAIDLGIIKDVTRKDLPLRGKKRRVKVVYKRKERKMPIPVGGESIHHRPFGLYNREEFGHWEMDTVKGKISNKKCILVLTERKTRFEIIKELESCTSLAVVNALNKIESEYKVKAKKIFKTITCDNGLEFSNALMMLKSKYTKKNRFEHIYYCDPYSSWQRGSNECANRFIRRTYPKGTDFDKFLDKNKLKYIQTYMNKMPRDILKGNTPAELFEKEVANL